MPQWLPSQTGGNNTKIRFRGQRWAAQPLNTGMWSCGPSSASHEGGGRPCLLRHVAQLFKKCTRVPSPAQAHHTARRPGVDRAAILPPADTLWPVLLETALAGSLCTQAHEGSLGLQAVGAAPGPGCLGSNPVSAPSVALGRL